MNYKLTKSVVIGAGTMGAAIAAHLANAGVHVTLLDIVPREMTAKEMKSGLSTDDRVVRNRIAQDGLTAALRSRPASFFTKSHTDLITIGNLEDDLGVVSDADWVIEAIIEKMDIKRALMARIDELRGDNTIVASNTSGLSINEMAEGRSEGFRRHFLGTHFFNPPRYLKLLEIIPTGDTSQEVIDFIVSVGEKRLGKGIVFCKDTPNFIANRVGSVGGAFASHFILENGYTVKEVDTVTGPIMGRPKTGTFRLLDLVGIDVWNYVGSNLAGSISHDQHAQKYLQSEKSKALMQSMLDNNRLGNKTKEGFYKTVLAEDGSKEFWELNLETLEYQPPAKVRFESVGRARKMDSLKDRLNVMLSAEDRAGDLVRALVYHGLAYASYMIPEIADTPKPIDDASRWGFNHEAGPFEMWDMLGVADTAQRMRDLGHPPAEWVDQMLKDGKTRFYDNGAVYNPDKKEYEPVKTDPLNIVLQKKKDAGAVVASNPSATMIDLGDGVACVEFHTKMNVMDTDMGLMINEALNRVETDFEGLVIGNDADNFSAGANLFLVVMNSQNGQWDEVDAAVKGLQDLHMRMRYFHKPVVVAPAGLALGGGAEMIMHGSRVVAASELYTGLVEMGAGVIPAGGGTKEMIRRIVNPPMRTDFAQYLAFIQRILVQIGQAMVAESAERAREMGILSETDRVVMNRSHLIAEAKREVLAMVDAGYTPPKPEKIYAVGRDGLASLRVAVYSFEKAKQITEYEGKMARKLANVIAGGELSQPQWVPEQYILDLEREAFLSLCGEEKTQQRMWNILQTGKPLRN